MVTLLGGTNKEKREAMQPRRETKASPDGVATKGHHSRESRAQSAALRTRSEHTSEYAKRSESRSGQSRSKAWNAGEITLTPDLAVPPFLPGVSRLQGSPF